MEYYDKYIEYKIKYNKLKNKLNHNTMIGGNDNKNIFYLFKADWCGHCISFKPTWNILKKDPNFKDKVTFITFDSEKHSDEFKKYNIKGFPTLLFKSNNEIIEYTDNRDIKNIKSFINNNIKN